MTEKTSAAGALRSGDRIRVGSESRESLQGDEIQWASLTGVEGSDTLGREQEPETRAVRDGT